MSLNKKEFYGGAITGSLPSFFIDASQFREIPDTQEVFVINDDPPSILKSHNNNEDNKSVIPIRIDKNDSLIIDIMERVDVNNDVESVKVHFEDIAIKNDVEGEWNILKLDKVKVPSLENVPVYIATGLEPSRKWGRDYKSNSNPPKGSELQPELVLILVVIRLKKYETDILISYNIPFITQESLKDLMKLKLREQNENNNNNNNELDIEYLASKRISSATKIISKLLDSFKIEDYGLFGV